MNYVCCRSTEKQSYIYHLNLIYRQPETLLVINMYNSRKCACVKIENKLNIHSEVVINSKKTQNIKLNKKYVAVA